MMLVAWIGVVAWSLATLCGVSALHEEKLLLRPLAGKILSHFDFSLEETSNRDERDDGSTTESLFPKIMNQILTRYDVNSLHLSLAVGRYDHDQYGPSQEFALGPFGARLQVELHRANGSHAPQETISPHEQERWKRITAELGALFSASLNQMDEKATVAIQDPVSPAHVGAVSAASSSSLSSLFLQAVLPREELCTENLTPWLKMLPCRSKAGLGRLVDPIKLLSGDYLALSFFASRSDEKMTLRQRMTSVQRLSAAQLTSGWSLRDVLLDEEEAKKTTSLLGSCPLASKSSIATEIDTLRNALARSADTSSSLAKTNGFVKNNELATVDLKKHQVNHGDTWLKHTSSPSAQLRRKTRPHSVSAHRFLTGHGQLNGGVATRIENRHPNCAMRISYYDTLPWFMRVYFGTFKAKLNDYMLPNPLQTLENVSFAPAEPRGVPNRLFFETILPPNTTMVFSVQFDRVFVRLSEHPPDANRGFDVGSATVRVEPASSCDHQETVVGLQRTIYTEPLLVALPTPDFSMPFNVIMMTSTVVAFFTGSLLNTLLRKAPRIKKLLSKRSTTN